jgi:hypothetical protein
VKTVLNDILVNNVQSKVKIVHESIPELYLENMNDQQEQFAPFDMLGKIAGKEMISKLVAKLIDKIAAEAYAAVGKFFKERAVEFKNAQAQPQDGVTIKLVWSNIKGISAIRTVINAIRGNLSIGNLSDLSIPKFESPNIRVEAGKKFN